MQKLFIFILFLFLGLTLNGDDRIGVATHFDQQGTSPQYNQANVMPMINSIGFGYFRDDLNWGKFETSPGVYSEYIYKQAWIDYAASVGLKFVACLAYPPSFYGHWDIQACANFAAWLAVDEGSKIAAIEVVNEPNNI